MKGDLNERLEKSRWSNIVKKLKSNLAEKETTIEQLQKTQSQILKRVADISPSLAKSIIQEFALKGEPNDHR